MTVERTWYTSDWHFGHRNILTLGAGRPFATIEEHDAALIYRHNALVAPGDVVWVLGDVALGVIEVSLACCARMNGRKFLIPGNHDRMTRGDMSKQSMWVDRYLTEGGFAGVGHASSIIKRLSNRQFVIMSHYPYVGDSQEQDRFVERRPVDSGYWLLHGHTHSARQVDGRQVHVGVDAWGYEPVSEEVVIETITSAVLEAMV